MIKIVHLSDIHIRNLQYHDEYRIVFDQVYKKIKEINPDIIINTGDTTHSKNNISPEYVQLCSEFLKNLADIAPLKIILGNHDLIVKNPNRTDSISPIVSALQHKNIELWKYSGEHVFNDDITFNVLGILDKEKWILNPTDQNKINIALYHGSISGCETDLGWTMSNAENDISIFQHFDYALCGDIHLENQKLDHEGRCRYAGSLLQNNHGESNNKGFLVWEIQDKDIFDVKHIAFSNPKPFITITLNDDGTIPLNFDTIPSSRIRIITNTSLSLEIIRKTIDVVKNKFKPESVIFVDRSDDKNSVSNIIVQYKKEDLRSLEVQERLIKEFLKEYKVNDKLLSYVYDINRKYDKLIEDKEFVARNVDYKIVKFEWNNLFKYGSGNILDFTGLNGIVGIFGKNASGKSSVIDALLFTIFNSFTKKKKKTVNVINTNNNSDFGEGKVILRLGEKYFRIKRKAEKYIKKLHGNETIEAKCNVDFDIIDPISEEVLECLNGNDADETNKNIVKYFGTMEDFLLTSLSSQVGSLSYIESGSTKRKEILGRILDLDRFSEKFDLANDDVSTIKASIKRFDNKNFDEEIDELKIKYVDNIQQIQKLEEQINILVNKVNDFQQKRTLLQEELKNKPDEMIDILDIQKQIFKKKNEILNINNEIISLNEKISTNDIKIKKVQEFIQKFDIQGLKNSEEELKKYNKEIKTILQELNEVEKDKKIAIEKEHILLEVPCGSEFSHCKFIKGAYEAKEQLVNINNKIEEKINLKNNIQDKLDILKNINVEDKLNKYTELLNSKLTFEHQLNNSKLLLENKIVKLSVLDKELIDLDEVVLRYENNKKIIDKFEILTKENNEIEQEIILCQNDSREVAKKQRELYKNVGSLDEKIEQLLDGKEELNILRTNYEAYDLFLKCMHTNGISYDIIKNSLPGINNEIAKNLASIVDFEVLFENEDDRLELYIKDINKKESLPLEMGSVAQKMLAAMAIRISFINVSSLPRSDIFILDEPGTSLDIDNIEGFIRMMEIVKTHFKCVVLITHLESLKDTADMVFNIENKAGIALISY